jgi:hypothetical protein
MHVPFTTRYIKHVPLTTRSTNEVPLTSVPRQLLLDQIFFIFSAGTFVGRHALPRARSPPTIFELRNISLKMFFSSFWGPRSREGTPSHQHIPHQQILDLEVFHKKKFFLFLGATFAGRHALPPARSPPFIFGLRIFSPKFFFSHFRGARSGEGTPSLQHVPHQLFWTYNFSTKKTFLRVSGGHVRGRPRPPSGTFPTDYFGRKKFSTKKYFLRVSGGHVRGRPRPPSDTFPTVYFRT